MNTLRETDGAWDNGREHACEYATVTVGRRIRLRLQRVCVRISVAAATAVAERRVLGSAGRSLALSRRLVVRCPCRPCAVCLAVAVSVRFLSVACGGGSCVLVVSGVSVVLLRVRPCPSVSVRVAPPSRPRFCFPVNIRYGKRTVRGTTAGNTRALRFMQPAGHVNGQPTSAKLL